MAIYKMKIGNKNINTYAKYDLKHLKDAAQKTNILVRKSLIYSPFKGVIFFFINLLSIQHIKGEKVNSVQMHKMARFLDN